MENRFWGYRQEGKQVIIIPTPSSSPECLVFPYDKPTRKFNTNNYFPYQTQDRINMQELEEFLDKVNVPIKEWYDKYAYLFEGSFRFYVVFVICLILIPLALIWVIWLNIAQYLAIKKQEEYAERGRAIVKNLQRRFPIRGLKWNIPERFPQWIELLVQDYGYYMPDVNTVPQELQQPYAGFPQSEIQMTSMQNMNQQDSQNMGPPNQQGYYPLQENQYHGSTYGTDAHNAYA